MQNFFRDLYYEESEIFRNGKKLPTSKRLMVRGGEVLLSMSGTKVSPVTRISLKTPLIGGSKPVYLQEFALVEELVKQGLDVVIDGSPVGQLKSPSGKDGAYSLQLRNVAARYRKTLHFFHADDEMPYQSNFQWDSFNPTWTIKLPAQFFVRLNDSFVYTWFQGLGHASRIKRKENQTLGLTVVRDALRVIFNSTDGEPFTLTFDEPLAKWDEPPPATFLSKDIAPILFNLGNAARAFDN